MNTVEINPTINLVEEASAKKSYAVYKRFTDFTERQAGNRAAWFMASLLWQGVLCLPVPAFLIYYYNAPVWVVGITVFLFFTNLVAGMADSKVGTVIGLLAVGTLLHLAMILAFVF